MRAKCVMHRRLLVGDTIQIISVTVTIDDSMCDAGNFRVKKLLTDTEANTGGPLFIDSESGVTTIERRQRWTHARYSNSSTLPIYTRYYVLTICLTC